MDDDRTNSGWVWARKDWRISSSWVCISCARRRASSPAMTIKANNPPKLVSKVRRSFLDGQPPSLLRPCSLTCENTSVGTASPEAENSIRPLSYAQGNSHSVPAERPTDHKGGYFRGESRGSDAKPVHFSDLPVSKNAQNKLRARIK